MAYEQLRRQMVGGAPRAGPGGLGLTRLLQEGLPGWLAAVAALGVSRSRCPAAVEPGPSRRDAPMGLHPTAMRPPALVPPHQQAMVTLILAGMVLSCRRGATRESSPSHRERSA